MGYTAFIKHGKSTMGSVILPTKIRLSEYVKRNPLGNYNTKVLVTNTRTNKTLIASKIHFYNPKRWKI